MTGTDGAQEPRFSTVAELTDWMIDGARPSADAREIVTGICDGLVGLDVAVDRFMLFIYTLHPNLQGSRFRWIKGEGVDIAHAKMGTFSQEVYTSNPLPRVVEQQETIRRHLEREDCPDDYIIVGELREQGFTDYIALPLIFTTGETHACTWSSAQEGGFSDRDLDILKRINAPLARLTETYMVRLNAAVLLSTYVGRNSGTLIRDGKVHRGDGEEITAVILFVDLKNFTRLSNEIAGSELVSLLNDTFDHLVPSVTSRGGEVLKFMGDGFFAIFPYSDEKGLAEMAAAAMDAVDEGAEALSKDALGDSVSFRAALHCGTFHYGNIGGADRLDFTAIGPPVNYTARLLSAATGLGCDKVASSDIASRAPGRCDNAGSAELKGFTGEQTIWRF
ncbi:adenylate/guanylate cyclase domain-containing protein [Nitratireductor sp. XY-223]|uniref:adenylate/guanylate cyclase domain-containing protein n=1 Tax=Nitratireductor sp. XY-223 TaxID=2561926 RepID=UPI0010AAFD44|nr:adenylate/guanylate cyclase domain-containing protein [Nitratireductor sp. XY-223]